MDSLFEKITLYDLLGYTLPGFSLLLIILPYTFEQMPVDLIDFLSENQVYAGVIILACSYIVGVVLSELSKYVLKIPIADKWLKEFVEKMDNSTSELSLEVKKKTCEALKKSKLPRKEGSSEDDISEEDKRMMYSDIQVDNNYKRIHNYASSEVMYKNMFMSFLIGDFLLLLLCAYQVIVYGSAECYMYVELGMVFAAIFLFYSRWVRFSNKKMYYTAIWFIEKYMNP